MTKLTPEVVRENRSNLADAYADLLKVANGDKAKLLAGITNLEGISESNRKEFEGLSAEEIVRRIILHIAELRPVQQASPTPEVYSHGQVAQETERVQAKAAETAKETNEHGVSIEAITNFVSSLKLKFGVAKEKVLERLQTSLSPEKLNNLMYFQNNGHQLDVTGVTAAGELEFDTCSIESPEGEHRSKNYFQALELATQNGATLMTTDKYRWFREQGTILDPRTWSWLLSPNAGTPQNPGRAFDGSYGGVIDSGNPYDHDDNGAFRVSLRV